MLRMPYNQITNVLSGLELAQKFLMSKSHALRFLKNDGLCFLYRLFTQQLSSPDFYLTNKIKLHALSTLDLCLDYKLGNVIFLTKKTASLENFSLTLPPKVPKKKKKKKDKAKKKEGEKMGSFDSFSESRSRSRSAGKKGGKKEGKGGKDGSGKKSV
jgi:hypothetical protein